MCQLVRTNSGTSEKNLKFSSKIQKWVNLDDFGIFWQFLEYRGGGAMWGGFHYILK